MTITDYILDLTLIGLVLLQIRGRRLSFHTLLIPLGISGYIATQYLQGVPTSGNSLLLVVACAAVGVLLGAGAGLFTRVYRKADGRLYAKAGVAAAVLWILGTGSRLAFQLYATHGGGQSVVHFSAAHHISMQAWVAALILMAIGEAATRTLTIAGRAFGSDLLKSLSARPGAQALSVTH